jgi:hypothetical protein
VVAVAVTVAVALEPTSNLPTLAPWFKDVQWSHTIVMTTMSDSSGNVQPDQFDNYGDIRIYPLLRRGAGLIEGMTMEELRGASLVFSLLSDHMQDLWFVQRVAYNRRALVKTLGDLYEISEERLQHMRSGSRQ